MLFGILLASALLLLILVGLWLRNRGEVVDLTSPRARQRAAAQWLADGESEEAERMLVMAVEVLEGWPKALARADLANVMAALGRKDEAISQLHLACQCTVEQESQNEHALEMKIQLANWQLRSGDFEAAVQHLRAGEEQQEQPTLRAMRKEALGEILVFASENSQALPLLEEAFERLCAVEHDRAASCLVTLAYVRQCLETPSPWQGLERLPSDLQRGVCTNFSDRFSCFASHPARLVQLELITALEGFGGWQEERTALRQLVDIAI